MKTTYIIKMFKETHLNNIKLSTLYILIGFMALSCTKVLEGNYTWDSFIQEASNRGETFFAEATAPNGFIAFGSSNDSQWGANSMATRQCSENSGQVCQVTRTTSK